MTSVDKTIISLSLLHPKKLMYDTDNRGWYNTDNKTAGVRTHSVFNFKVLNPPTLNSQTSVQITVDQQH